MLSANEILSYYTAEVLAWNLSCEATTPLPEENAESAARTAERVLRMAALGGKSHIILIGAGDGTMAGILAQAPEIKNGKRGLIILENDANCARSVSRNLPSEKNIILLADASPFALYFLLLYAGIEAGQCAVCRNSAKDKSSAERALLKSARSPLALWERMFIGGKRVAVPPSSNQAELARISAACILHPEERELESFFEQFPPYLREVVVVWDADSPPQQEFSCAAPLRHYARPLRGDFSAQRNAMIQHCQGEFCLYLDADERLEAHSWSVLVGLCAIPGLGGALFPRLTFERDEDHVRMGYGLWPDPQLRFFRLGAGLFFSGAVHEKVERLNGLRCFVPGTAILHYSHVRKNAAELRARLEVFNEAAGSGLHRLNSAYPCLPLDFFNAAQQNFGRDTVIVLPD